MLVIPPTGRLLGVDIGSVRIGLALCDADRFLASPYETYTRRNAAKDNEYFIRLVKEERIVGLVVGLPIHMSGQESTQSIQYREQGLRLGLACGLPVVFWDERCTTSAAEDMLWDAGLSHKRRKERRDKLAAALFLQSYLEAGRPKAVAPEPVEYADGFEETDSP